MKNFLSVALIIAVFLIVGCGSEKSARQENSKPTVPVNVIREKLKELSAGLDVHFDDMKEITYYHCPIDSDIHPSIWIAPYVAVDKNYEPALFQGILYVGNEPLYFDTLYIKTSKGVESFQYPKAEKSTAGEKYNGLMTDALYKKLQSVIDEGGAKFRLSGKTFGEREFTSKEIANMKKVFAIYELLNTVKVEK